MRARGEMMIPAMGRECHLEGGGLSMVNLSSALPLRTAQLESLRDVLREVPVVFLE